MNINPAYYDRVRYTLRNTSYGSTFIVEPIGWNEDEKRFKRGDSHGVFTLLSNNLQFHTGIVTFPNGDVIDGGFSYVTGVYKQQGVNGSILLIKEEKNPQTDFWEEAYRGFLFFPSPMVIEDNTVSLKFKESSFYNSLLARRDKKLELDRLTTMDGDDVDPLTTSLLAISGRDILLVSQLEIASTFENPIALNIAAVALPVAVKSSSDDSVQFITDLDVDFDVTYQNGVTGNMFYADSDGNKVLELRLDIEYFFGKTTLVNLNLDLVTYENGTDYDFKSVQTLKSLNSVNTATVEHSETLNIELLDGESLALVSNINSIATTNYGWTRLNITVSEDSTDDNAQKQAKFVLPFETLNRLLHITTGEENTLVSNFLGRTDIEGYTEDGEGALSGIAHGHWIRGFDALPVASDNKFKPLNISFKDFEEAFETVWDTGYSIERKGLTNLFRFEERKYFYQRTVTVSLPNQANKIKRTVAIKYMYNALEFGAKKPSGDNLYEEAMGLDEHNTKNTSTTPIKPIENNYSKVSPMRTDGYGITFASRKSIKTNPTEDTRYDNDLFLFDLKRGLTTVFEQRLWQDDFAKQPTGVYSPDTALNLRFSPANIRTRHGWWIRGGMNIYKNDFIRYSGSIGNSKLATQLTGADEIAENGNIKVRDLESPFFEPEIIEFEHEATTEILQNLQSRTLIDGNNVLNYYGLMEFINEKGKFEYGYLLELQPNNEGKWELLKSSKKVSNKSILEEPLEDFTLTAPVLSSDNLTSNSVDLDWTDTISSIGLANYRVYLDGKIIANPTVNNFDVTGLTPDTDYSLFIMAIDRDSNKVTSNLIEITTLA